MCWVKHEACLSQQTKNCGGEAKKPASTNAPVGSGESKKSHTTDEPVVGSGESKKSHTTDEPVVTTKRKEVAEKEAKQAEAEFAQMVKTITTEIAGVMQKVKLQGKKSATDFIDAFVRGFLEAMKADLKSSGRRLAKLPSMTKTLDLLFKLPKGYNPAQVVAWINKNSKAIQAALVKLNAKYKLHTIGLGPESVGKISASQGHPVKECKADGKGMLCIKLSVTATIPFEVIGWLTKSVKDAMAKAATKEAKEQAVHMNNVMVSVFRGGFKLDQVFKLIFLLVPDLASSGRRLETVQSMKPEAANIELDLFLTPPEGVSVDDLKKVATAVKKEDLAASMNAQIKQMCPKCPDLEILDLPPPKTAVVCPIGQKCVQPADESSAMQTGCWSMLILLSMLVVDRQA